jgi:hypothetical protein
MKAIDIAKYIDKNVGTFLDIEIVGPGIAYHYSRHVRIPMKSTTDSNPKTTMYSD